MLLSLLPLSSPSFRHTSTFLLQNSSSQLRLCSNQKSCKSEAPENCPLLEAEGVVRCGVPVKLQSSGLMPFWLSYWQLDPRAAVSPPFCLSSQCFRLVLFVYGRFKSKRFLQWRWVACVHTAWERETGWGGEKLGIHLVASCKQGKTCKSINLLNQANLTFCFPIKENAQYLHSSIITFHFCPTLLCLWCSLSCLLAF